MTKTLLRIACAADVVAVAVTPAIGQTVAYYRFEDASVSIGAPVPNPGATGGGPYSPLLADSSGNGNDLRTFADFTAPVGAVPLAGPLPQTGAANTKALSFTPNQDIYTAGTGGPDNLRNPVTFASGFTVELSVNVSNRNRFNGLVGKDGRASTFGFGGDPNLSPFQMKTRGDSLQFQVEMVDAGGTFRQIQTSYAGGLAENRWYHLAAVSDGSLLSLYAFDSTVDSEYQLVGTSPIVGGIFSTDDNVWTVGRGFYDNINDWTAGTIDEVRISASALAPGQFLYSVPEPSSGLLAGAAGLGWWWRRKRLA